MDKIHTQAFADQFLKYDYTETKDMCKQFLTLVSAILVTSLTFSDKITSLGDTSSTSKWLMLVAWSSFLLAIIFCGIGLLIITIAAGNAAGGGSTYRHTAYRSYVLIVLAGVCFVSGLILLIATALKALNAKEIVLEKKQAQVTLLHKQDFIKKFKTDRGSAFAYNSDNTISLCSS